MNSIKWEISNDDVLSDRADQSVLIHLNKHHPELSFTRSRVQNLIKDHCILLNGKTLRPSSKLKSGDLIVISIPENEKLDLTPKNLDLEILYEDEYLAVINKPKQMSVHPSESDPDDTLVHALLFHIKNLSGIGGVLRPGIVHRIDKDTSGVLVITKNDEAHQKLAEAFKKHSIKRKYWALCYGTGIPKLNKKVESKLGRNPKDRKKIAFNVNQGKTAITHYRILENYGNFACLIEAELETGRTHQVRVHLTHEQHSVLGDPVYGIPSSKNTKWLKIPPAIRKLIESLEGQALHARVLGFHHPKSGQWMEFEAKPTEDFLLLLQQLKKYKDEK